MTQLILDTTGYNVQLPETHKGGYNANTEELSVEVTMVLGNIVKEIRGSVWRVSYQYGYFDDEMKNAFIAACEKGRKQPITCGFLEQGSEGILTYANFFVTSFRRPKFMWSKVQADGTSYPLWGDFYVELREVEPHD